MKIGGEPVKFPSYLRRERAGLGFPSLGAAAIEHPDSWVGMCMPAVSRLGGILQSKTVAEGQGSLKFAVGETS